MENIELKTLQEVAAREAAVKAYKEQRENEIKKLDDAAERTIIDKVILPIIERYKIKSGDEKNSAVDIAITTRECDVCHKVSSSEEMYSYAGKMWCKDCLCNLLMFQMKFKKSKPFVYDENNPRPQRPNELCSCGSGKKYKKCCGAVN